MRWFLIPAVAALAITLAGPAPAKAQFILGGNPTYNPRYSIPFVQYPRVVTPASPAPIPYFNGSPVDLAVDSMLRSAGLSGYGPYAGKYAPFGSVYPANYNPWAALQPYNPTATNWKWVDPRSGNPGLHRGWFKGR